MAPAGRHLRGGGGVHGFERMARGFGGGAGSLLGRVLMSTRGASAWPCRPPTPVLLCMPVSSPGHVAQTGCHVVASRP